MDYEKAVKYYTDSPKFLQILGNDNLIKLLNYLGNPHESLDYIHVAGTNGKGSVCLMIAEALRLTGKKVGLFTSPYINVFNERIQINGKNISNSDLVRLTERLDNAISALSIELSSFAKITALAFMYFFEQKCDIVVLETGLGGRLDATNVIQSPILSVITKIALDHTEYLGDTIPEITAEKCGIIKPLCPVLTLKNQNPEAIAVIEKFAEKNKSELLFSKEKCGFELGLNGDFQKENASLAEAALRFLGVSEDNIKKGFKKSQWPARFELIKDNLLIDGAHNPDGISATLASLSKLHRPVHFVIAMMRDKNFEESAKLINEFGGSVTVTELNLPRCLKAEELSKYFPSAILERNSKMAVKNALLSAKENELVCVLGSLYLAGEIRKEFTNA
ncbi:MAG: bifunctional folylpolyglutamate synthase/dihydrofolate synthase [Firmicutes bacterium]|nr:bifunctional folylpolyglutamate synthase/dihydrofolate synthase [Bacillota bacterium]